MRIGITERGDAGIDFAWTSKIDETDFSILITKNTTTEKFHKEVLKHKNKILLHATITGWGNTALEPYVPDVISSIASVTRLVQKGFPANQIVWRLDPILPVNGDEGLRKAHWVFKNIDINRQLHNITRIRVSVLDAYPHSRERLMSCGIVPNFTGFKADDASFKRINDMLAFWKSKGYSVEACAEPELNAKHIGCVNAEDAKIFNLDLTDTAKNKQNRHGCLCSTAKTELLANRKQCPHRCSYCYWK
jgi:DNA repair photolyase